LLPSGTRTAPGSSTTCGRERAEAEYRMLLDDAGFTLARVIPTPSPLSIVEAVPR